MLYLITGAAGFIGFHTSLRLLADGHQVVGIDNINDYYDPRLKEARLAILTGKEGFQFQKLALEDVEGMGKLFSSHSFDRVIHMAALAGVRYSLQNPLAYVQSNLLGFANILENCRHSKVPHLVYASSSSVYGGNKKQPFSVKDRVDHPVSLYAATKKANELMAHSYSHLYSLPTTGLRFFTVYGPWGRPDMAYFSFARSIIEGREIQVFNNGKMKRDFTYIDDVVEGIVRISNVLPGGASAEEGSPYAKVYNIGNHQPVDLVKFIEILEVCLGKQAVKKFLPMQPGDVAETYADVSELEQAIHFKPMTSLEVGLGKFVEWYKTFYQG